MRRLAGGGPSVLTTYGPAIVSTYASAASSSPGPNARYAAVGTPAAASTSFIHFFEPSSRAAALSGPNARCPRACSSSTTPATSGGAAPTATRSGLTPAAASPTLPRSTPSARRQAPNPAERGHTGVAGRADDLTDLRRAREAPRERVLASSGSDDEDARAIHAASTSGAPLPVRNRSAIRAFGSAPGSCGAREHDRLIASG